MFLLYNISLILRFRVMILLLSSEIRILRWMFINNWEFLDFTFWTIYYCMSFVHWTICSQVLHWHVTTINDTLLRNSTCLGMLNAVLHKTKNSLTAFFRTFLKTRFCYFCLMQELIQPTFLWYIPYTLDCFENQLDQRNGSNSRPFS